MVAVVLTLGEYHNKFDNFWEPTYRNKTMGAILLDSKLRNFYAILHMEPNSKKHTYHDHNSPVGLSPFPNILQ